MKALLCILLLAGISFSAAGSISTESLPLDFTNPYAQTDAPTESLVINFTNPYVQTDASTEALPLDFFNPYMQANSPTEMLSIGWTSFGVDFPVIYALGLAPARVNYLLGQPISISANLTSAYSQDIAHVDISITGCGNISVENPVLSGTCSASCIYTGSFTPTQNGTCEVTMNATSIDGKSGYAQASAVSSDEIDSSTQYFFNSTTGPDGIAGISIASLPGPSSTMFIRTGGSAEIVQIGTSASSLYMNVLVKLGKIPAPNKEVSVEVI